MASAVPAELLLDTGALVALLDASERRHADCKATFAAWHAGVVTTEAVVTEAAYLLAWSRWHAAAPVLLTRRRYLEALDRYAG